MRSLTDFTARPLVGAGLVGTAAVTGRGDCSGDAQRGVGTSAGHQRGLIVATSGDLIWPPVRIFHGQRTAGGESP